MSLACDGCLVEVLHVAVQLVTDLNRGGVAYFLKGKAEKDMFILEERCVVRMGCLVSTRANALFPHHRVLPSMEELKGFVQDVFKGLPADLGGYMPDGISPVWPDCLDGPKRVRFEVSRKPGRSTGLLAALEGYYNSLDDVANLRDLEGFPELVATPEQPQLSYFS